MNTWSRSELFPSVIGFLTNICIFVSTVSFFFLYHRLLRPNAVHFTNTLHIHHIIIKYFLTIKLSLRLTTSEVCILRHFYYSPNPWWDYIAAGF